MAEEKNFENRIKQFLFDNECWFVKYFANAYTKSGIPDILACCNGCFLAIEVKASNGKPSELQRWNRDRINNAGGIALILYPNQMLDFENLVFSLLDGNIKNALAIAKRINERTENA